MTLFVQVGGYAPLSLVLGTMGIVGMALISALVARTIGALDKRNDAQEAKILANHERQETSACELAVAVSQLESARTELAGLRRRVNDLGDELIARDKKLHTIASHVDRLACRRAADKPCTVALALIAAEQELG